MAAASLINTTKNSVPLFFVNVDLLPNRVITASKNGSKPVR